MRGQPWKYVFFADVESDLNDPEHGDLLEQLGHACNSFRILGCYPTGPQLDRMSIAERRWRMENHLCAIPWKARILKPQGAY